MKKYLLVLALLCLHSSAFAQCNGVFPSGTVCGNPTGPANIPHALPLTTFALAPAGSSGDVQTNNGTGGLGALTNIQLTARIQPVTSALSGAIGAFPNDTTKFYRGDGTYAAPPATSLTVGTTPIISGTTLGFLYNTAGVLANSSFLEQVTNSASTPTIKVGTAAGSGDDTAVLTARTLAPASGLLNTHAYRDETSATQNVTGSAFSGYGAFDAAAIINGAAVTPMNHIRNFQARMTYNSTGVVSEYAGLWVGPTINQGTITASYGAHVVNAQINGGAITSQYAFYADTLSGAGANWFLFGGNNPSALQGQLYVGGNLSSFQVEQMNVKYNGATQQGMATLNTASGAGTATALNIVRNNSIVGSISETLSATAFNTSSDERLKTFLGRYDPINAVKIIRADPVREFNWKKDGSHAIGWGAQTSYAISHDLATPGQSPDATWGMDFGKRAPYLWAAVSQLLDRVDYLEKQLNHKRVVKQRKN